MSINYITSGMHGFSNKAEIIAEFESNMSMQTLKLLEGKNVALQQSIIPTFGMEALNGPMAAFTLIDDKPTIVIFMNVILTYRKMRFPKFLIKKMYNDVIKHELIHHHQYDRGDLTFKGMNAIWKGKAINAEISNYGVNGIDAIIAEVTKPYELEAYAYCFSIAPWHSKIFAKLTKKNRLIHSVIKKGHLEEFGKPFDRKVFDQIFNI